MSPGIPLPLQSVERLQADCAVNRLATNTKCLPNNSTVFMSSVGQWLLEPAGKPDEYFVSMKVSLDVTFALACAWPEAIVKPIPWP